MSTRRDFLNKTGVGLLAGYAFNPGIGLAQSIKTPNTDKYQSFAINTHEWYGDIEERLDSPKDWEINYIKMAGHDTHVLTGDEIRRRVQSPIKSKRLSEIAAGKKTAVVTFDDLTRPTPVGTIAKYVLEELNAAGIDDEHILFIAGVGNHQILDQIQVKAKLGEEIVNRCPWINHNVMDNHIEVGRTSFGNRIEINNYFMKTDVKVTISGIKAHGAAGYGGGGKAIVPGVCSFSTTYYNHLVIAGYTETGAIGNQNKTLGAGKIFKNELRLDMEEAARLAGVDFSVQIVYNGKREPVAVYAGDIRESHVEACRYANKHYVCKPVTGADIAINNTYPFSRQASPGMAASSIHEGGSVVMILQNPMCRSTIHYLELNKVCKMESYWDTFVRKTDGGRRGRNIGQLIIFSQYMQKRDLMRYYNQPYVKLARTWEEVLGYLESAHRGGARVALYPYGGIQHSPIEIG